ncbi:MAG: glycosyltransferase family 4 protein, partial [Saprospiraceae bacterium]|nr:glycosyltransferase family 4 protein [Saprospiraceae bacterium]
PIVASDLPGMREVIQHQVNGLLVPPGEPETLAKGIAEIFADPSAAARMGEAGWMITRERYSWQKIALQTERLYGNLLAQKINPSVSGKAVLDKSKYSRFTKLVSAHF